jgi:hypothetical protein
VLPLLAVASGVAMLTNDPDADQAKRAAQCKH